MWGSSILGTVIGSFIIILIAVVKDSAEDDPLNQFGPTRKSMSLMQRNPPSVHSEIGKPCNLDDPFKCGINSICLGYDASHPNKGICDCCDQCIQLNGSCVLPDSSSPEIPSPNLSPDTSNSSVITGISAFAAILCLFLTGGFIFYGLKYNGFTRIRNRLRIFYLSWCTRRVVSVSDQGNMFHPADDDEPALL